MFGGIKRILHRGGDDDYDNIRSQVLGDEMGPPPAFARPPEGPQRGQQGYDDFTPKTRDVFEPFTPGGKEDFPSFPTEHRKDEKVGRDYDILERLDMIESQVAVIRSQTETINERLKNIDAKLGTQRRY